MTEVAEDAVGDIDPLHQRLSAVEPTTSLDAQKRAAQRFGALVLALSSAWLLTRLVGVGFSLSSGGPLLASSDWLTVAALGLSVAMFTITRQQQLAPSSILRIGLAYVVVIALLISLTEHYEPWPEGYDLRGAPYVCWWLILWPFILPTATTRAAAISLAAALTAPMALKISVATLGNPEQPVELYLRLFLTTGIAGVVGLVPSRILHSLTADVQGANEIGGYRLLKRIGSGGMGEVWSAEHKTLARPAALKIIRPEALGSSAAEARTMLARFEREASATAALRSPHTIILYDFGTTNDGTFYYVMELLDGFELRALVERFGPLPPARVVNILIQACSSLAEAHERNLIHRDINPSNIFLCRLGGDVDFVKVLDFGLVKSTFEPADARLTAEGMTSGTPAYMAPELARGQRAIAPTADLYALGCVAYFLLTGSPVFKAGTAVQMLVRQIEDRPAPVSEHAPSPVPEGLEKIIMSCLAKDPEQRPASARELADALRAVELSDSWSNADAEAWWRTEVGEDVIDLAKAGAPSVETDALPQDSTRSLRRAR